MEQFLYMAEFFGAKPPEGKAPEGFRALWKAGNGSRGKVHVKARSRLRDCLVPPLCLALCRGQDKQRGHLAIDCRALG